MPSPLRIAIFGSGSGSNAQAILDHFRDSSVAEAALVLSENPQAGILQRASAAGVPTHILQRGERSDAELLSRLMEAYGIDVIALAGYLKKLPASFTRRYEGRILNVHPSLLPKHGGKGMYGQQVHEAVLAAGETESGVTIHYVTPEYDAGAIRRQQRLTIDPQWDAETLKVHIQALEHKLFPAELEALCREISAKKA